MRALARFSSPLRVESAYNAAQMSVLAKTEAAGGTGMHPEMLAFSSSLADDRALLREDLIGSLAHVVMLGKTGIVPIERARELQQGLLGLWDEAARGTLTLPEEEDVHMAIEILLAERLGEAGKMVHSARSRNDQVATALHLHVREHILTVEAGLRDLIGLLLDMAARDRELLLPSYTHRQRAQPVSVAHYCLAWASMFLRDLASFSFTREQANRSPLGAGAIAGSTLPIDRQLTSELLGFDGPSFNAMDTVGDRDFITDYLYAGAKLLGHASRLATDMIDFASSEFGFIVLDDAIACGSSMMPQKKNPDIFELIRGKSAPQIGALVSLLICTKGLPSGYNRDLQEDRRPLLDTSARLTQVISALRLALSKLRFSEERCLRAAQDGSILATDLAEALVKRGVPFRAAYGVVGKLVRLATELGVGLGEIPLERAQAIEPSIDAEVLAAATLQGALLRKTSTGGAGLASIDAQIATHRATLQTLVSAEPPPRLDDLLSRLRAVTL